MTKTLMSDFKDVSRITYKDYEYLKAFQLLDIQNIPSNFLIRKTHNKLYINEKVYSLEDISISSFVNILLDNVPNLQIFRYEENPIGYLNVSSLFLADFDTFKIVELSTSKDVINDYWFDDYKDEFDSNYELQSFKIKNSLGVIVPYSTKGNKILIQGKTDNFKVFCIYKAKDLKINFMQEFPISNVSQLFSMSKDIY